MARERGLRSSNDAKPWKCRCGAINHPKKRRFSDVRSWECRGCKREFKGSFKFCLGEIEVDGGSLIGEVWDQGDDPYCVAFAYGKGIEVVERVSCVNNGTDPNEVECIDPIELEDKLTKKFPVFASNDGITKDKGLHKVLHMGLLLKEEGIPKMSSRDNYQLEDLSTIPRDDFSSIIDCLAEGVPFVATYLAGKRRSKLKYCQIYKSPPRSRYAQKKVKRTGHAVLLIGGGMDMGRKFFFCVNSWNTKFCPRRNSRGEIIKGGIGKIRASDLTKNVIKLSRPEKTDPCRRLEAQDVLEISSKNYILMMASKGHFAHLLRRQKVKSEKTDENLQCDDEIKKFREDHLVHGPFCNDEAEYPQNLVDRYKECSFEEMEDNLINIEKLRCTKVTSKETYEPPNLCVI
uniref:Uncharacterized protein n=1 Tax=Avena sativa TaxID=4498 RepID=A0ACD5W4B9_AVESA